MKYIKISAKVERRLEDLKQSGKAGKIIAEKITTIIENLKSDPFSDAGNTSFNFTRYGEKRLKYCRKIDLGCGYRLIILQKDSTLIIPFLGTHDETQRWLETNNKSKMIGEGKGIFISCDSNKGLFSTDLSNDDDGYMDENEDEYPVNLSEQDLRIVFRGLIEGAEKGAR